MDTAIKFVKNIVIILCSVFISWNIEQVTIIRFSLRNTYDIKSLDTINYDSKIQFVFESTNVDIMKEIKRLVASPFKPNINMWNLLKVKKPMLNV